MTRILVLAGLGVVATATFAQDARAQTQRGLIWGQAALEAITFPAGIVKGIQTSSRNKKFRKELEKAQVWNSQDGSKTRNLFGERADWNQVLEVQQPDGSIQNVSTEYIDERQLFSFQNDNVDFIDVRDRTIGYCWGYSSVLRRFKYLATFDASGERPDSKTLKKKIADILKYKKAHFPGFSDLRAMSNDREASYLMKKAVVSAWEKLAVRGRALGHYWESRAQGRKGFDATDAREFIAALKSRIESGGSPLVMLFHKEAKRYVHVIPVYELRQYKNEDGSLVYRACFIDNHGTPREHDNCGKYFLISDQGRLELPEWNRIEDEDGNVVYQNFKPQEGNLSWVDFTPDDEAESWLLLKGISQP